MPPPKGSFNPIEGPADYTFTQKVHNDSYPFIDPIKANLSGKAVFIAGASKGLGKTTAISFAKAGASYIAIGARSSVDGTSQAAKAAAKEAGRPEPKILSLKLDVADRQSVEAAAKKIGEEFGRLDVLIINAGILGRGTVEASDPDEWWQIISVNIRGPYLLTHYLLPLISQSTLKTIITVSSVGALLTSPGLSAYQVSKTAATRLAHFTAKETAEQGVVCFSIHPGNMLTEITNGMDASIKHIFTESTELAADSMVFLSRERREWLSGRYLNVTWDLEELLGEEKRKEIVEGNKLMLELTV